MKKFSFLLCFCVSFLISQGCQKSDSRKTETENVNVEIIAPPVEPTPKPENKNQTFTGGKADFEGVSFAYNQKIFGNVKAELVPESPLDDPDDKPDYVEPQHRVFTFDLPSEYAEMEVAVYPINDFPRMYAVNGESVKYIKQEIADFKTVLKNKNFRVSYFIPSLREIPCLLFRDASQDFQVKVKHYPFAGGKGILFVTFWETEVEMPSNRQLEYTYEGLTNDGKYYIWAEMPLNVNFLSDTSTDEYDSYKISGKSYTDKLEMKRYKTAIKKVAVRLENLPQNKFKPQLSEFEKIISSLKIEK